MHLVYIDDSGDPSIGIFSALSVPAANWNETFARVRQFRRDLRKSDGIDIHKELHAWKFVSGRGHPGNRPVSIERRCEIFLDTLRLVATFPGASLFNVAYPPRKDVFAYERLLNRIQKNMEVHASHAVLFSDEGKEMEYNRIRRRMAVHNPIPSALGAWEDGRATKNIVIDRIIEDIVFKDSKKSVLVQMVDFCAYALLRRERPLESKSRYGIDKGFDLLRPILVVKANRRDSDGIVRV